MLRGLTSMAILTTFGSSLAQEFQSLWSQLGGVDADARGITARAVDTGREPFPDRIKAGNEENRYRRGSPLGCLRDHQTSGRSNQGDVAANQIGGHPPQPIVLTLGPTVLNRDILALDVSGFIQTMVERSHERGRGAGRRAVKEADYRQCGRLRLGPERPRCRHAAEKR
jgi:hypothetical protein